MILVVEWSATDKVRKRMLTMRQKKAITAAVQNRYTKETKKDKSKILDEFSATTGHNRVYAALL